MNEPHDTSTTVCVHPDVTTDRFLATLWSHGVVSAYLFGSVARGKERPDSDLDLLVAFGDDSGSFAERFRLSEELSLHCGRRVDLLTKIHLAFEPYITPTLVPLPL